MGNYITEAQVRGFEVAGDCVVPASVSDAAIAAAIVLAEAMVESICNDIFYVKTETNKFDGNGKMTLFFFPEVPYRCIAVTSCLDYDIDGTLQETFVEGTDFVRYDHYLETSRAWAGDRPRRGVFRGGVWPLGQDNIWVEGTWGRSTVPPEITRACLLLAVEDVYPGATKMAPADVSQAVWPDFTVTFRGGESVGKQTGFAKVDRLLSRHINWVDVFNVP